MLDTDVTNLFPNSEIYILKDIPITGEDKPNFFGKGKYDQVSFFLGNTYKNPIEFAKTSGDPATIDYNSMYSYYNTTYDNLIYVSTRYSIIRNGAIKIPINISQVNTGNYLIFRNNIKAYPAITPNNSMDIDDILSNDDTREFREENINREIGNNLPDYVGDDFFYCFIEGVEYVNPNTTVVSFGVDLLTTWSTKIIYKSCYIEREHSYNRPFYWDYIREDFNYEEDLSSYTILNFSNNMNDYLACMLTTGELFQKIFVTASDSSTITNIPNKTCVSELFGTIIPYYQYVIEGSNDFSLTEIIKSLMYGASLVGNGDNVSSILMLPKTAYTSTGAPIQLLDSLYISRVGPLPDDLEVGIETHTNYELRYLTSSGGTTQTITSSNIDNSQQTKQVTVSFNLPTPEPGEHAIKNNKTYSYIKVGVSSDNGVIEYPTHWLTSTSITFNIKLAALIPEYAVVVYPTFADGATSLSLINMYSSVLKGVTSAVDYPAYIQTTANNEIATRLTIENAQTQLDTANTVAQNTYDAENANSWVNFGGSILSSIVGANPAGGINAVANVITSQTSAKTNLENSKLQASSNFKISSNNVKASLASGSAANQLKTVGSISSSIKHNIGQNSILLNVRYPNHTYLQMIDDYFSAYGYKTNRYGVPLWVSYNGTANGCRSKWNYIKTINCNFQLNRPLNEIELIRNEFNEGVRLWEINSAADLRNMGFNSSQPVWTDNPMRGN